VKGTYSMRAGDVALTRNKEGSAFIRDESETVSTRYNGAAESAVHNIS
jgi:hypothetical protein